VLKTGPVADGGWVGKKETERRGWEVVQRDRNLTTRKVFQEKTAFAGTAGGGGLHQGRKRDETFQRRPGEVLKPKRSIKKTIPWATNKTGE